MGKLGEYRIIDQDGKERLCQSDWEDKVYSLKVRFTNTHNGAPAEHLIIDRATYYQMRAEAFPGNFNHTDKAGETFMGLKIAILENCSETVMEVK